MRDYNNTHGDRVKRLIVEARKAEHAERLVNYEHEKARTLDDFKKRMNHESRNTDNVLKISVLTEENKRLKKDYAEVIKKTNILIDAYRKLKTENETLVKKKNKTDYRTKTISNVKKFIIEIVDDIIKWINS